MSLAVQTQARPAKPKRSNADIIVLAMQRSGMLPCYVQLTLPQAMAMSRFFGDMHASWGSSGSLAPPVLDKIFAPAGNVHVNTPRCSTPAMERCQRAISLLRQHERDLVRWLVLAGERGNITLATLGREKAGVEEEDRARGIATGLMQSLGQTLAELYDAKNCWPQ